MMQYQALVTIMPLKNLLDPQGKAVMGGLQNLSLNAIKDVRIGKQIQLHIEAESAEAASAIANEAAVKLLANQVMEMFEIQVTQV